LLAKIHLVSVSVSKVSCLGLEGFRSRPRALRLETLNRLFFMTFCKEFLKKGFYKRIVQNLAVQRGQWLSFLWFYVICEMAKTIFPLPRLKFILNSIKNVHAPMKPQRVISQREVEKSALLTPQVYLYASNMWRRNLCVSADAQC